MANIDILGFFVVIFLGVLPYAYESIRTFRNYPDKIHPLSPFDFIYSFGQILLVSYITLNQHAGLSAIGLKFMQYRLDFILVGSIAGYGLIGIIVGIIKRLSGENSRQIIFDRSNLAIERTIIHHTFRQRIGYLIVLTIAVIAEEFVFRGYLKTPLKKGRAKEIGNRIS